MVTLCFFLYRHPSVIFHEVVNTTYLSLEVKSQDLHLQTFYYKTHSGIVSLTGASHYADKKHTKK
jgi:hypothetical protein